VFGAPEQPQVQPQQKESSSSSIPSWNKLGSNVNYRITAILDVNGGASEAPNFEGADADFLQDDAPTKYTKTPGYSVPVDILTLQDPTTGEYHQRVSYYSGKQVDYNVNGVGYKRISTPYMSKEGVGGANTCFLTGGSSTDAEQKVAYLNFFPTVAQMEHYTIGNMITTESGVPYRIAKLEAAHGSFNATSATSQPDASYEAAPGMPNNDWFEFHYEESLTSSGLTGKVGVARPLKWTMLARNQIINAHTENWVLRYLSYEAIDKDDERKLWGDWFDLNFKGDCEKKHDRSTLAGSSRNYLQLNRLGMFFSSTSMHSPAISALLDTNPSHFDSFLARNNKNYAGLVEYSKRESIHDTNTKNIEKWNKEHAGKTTFVANEFLDWEVKEVMAVRGGHIPRSESKSSYLRQPHVSLLGDSFTQELPAFTPYQLPSDFDPSTLPTSFDWRDHLPGSVGPIRDQGFCGSCWAFSFSSALESHWFIAHNQSVHLPEQFVNDCAWSDAAHACDGGDAGFAAKTIIDNFNGKVPTRDAYGGYLSVDGGCYVDILHDIGMMGDNELLSSTPPSSSSSMVTLSDWVVLPPRDDITTKHALFTKGPLSIAMNIVEEALYYANGVLDVASCSKHDVDNLDHAINLVGWGVDDLPDGGQAEHWIVRNSWSDLWGDSGYFKVRMGDRDCGVTTSAGYPVVSVSKHGLAEPSEKVATS